jgi:amino acid adenylation domain-containing protein
MLKLLSKKFSIDNDGTIMSLNLLKRASEQGVSISLSSGKLRIETYGKPLPADLRAEIVAKKPRILKLLAATEGSGLKKAQNKVMSVTRRGQTELPLSYSQQRLWFIDRLNEGSPEYNMIGAFTIEEDFNLDVAQSAINKIIERHQILRTVYRDIDGEAFQQVCDTFSFNIEKYDLSQFTPDRKGPELNRIIDGDAHKAFLLSKDLMIRVNFILLRELANKEHAVLTINIHHIASDGWSIDIFLKEFVEIYRTIIKGEILSLPELPIQYGDYASWQKEHLSKTQLSQQLSYWDKQLHGLPKTHNLSLSSSRAEIKHNVGKMLKSRLEIQSAKNLISLAKDLKMTPFMLIHASLALVLSNYSSRFDIVVGTPVANRKHSELENLIGFFSNSLPLRVSTAYQSLKGYLLNIRKTHVDAQENQDVPFELLVERQKLPRNLAYAPLFQIMLSSEMDYGVKAVAKGHQNTLLEAGLKTRPIEYTASKFDLEINVVFGKHSVHIYWLYDTSLFQEKLMTIMKQHFVIALDNLSYLRKVEQIKKTNLNELLAYRPLLHSYSESVDNMNNNTSFLESSEQTSFPINIHCVKDIYYQREWSLDNTLESQIAYWSKQLVEAPRIHSLVHESTRDANRFKSENLTAELPHELFKSLLPLAENYQLTPFMLLHAAFALVLSKHSNSNDIIIGSPLGHNSHCAIFPSKNSFLNMLVLRVDTHHKLLNDYLTHIRHVNSSAQINRNVPFEMLIDRLNISPCDEYSPLIQILLTTNLGLNESSPQLENRAEEVQLSNAQNGHQPFDIHLSLYASKTGAVLDWEYNGCLFSKKYIEQLNSHLIQLLTSLSELDESNLVEPPLLSDLEMLSQEERNLLLYQLNDTFCDYPSNFCIHELFEQRVKQNPTDTALVFGEKHLSYQQLNDKANQLAHYLQERYEIRPDTFVGLCFERSLEMVIGMFAIIKAGGAYVPLDPSYPSERLRYILMDISPEVVLAHKESLEKLNDFRGEILEIDSIVTTNGEFADYSVENIPPALIGLEPNHLAYVIYTSGSTGKPKGVMIEHGNTTSMLNWVSLEYNNGELTRTLASTSLNFDLSVFEIFAPLVTGNSCVMVKDILDLVENDINVTLINTVPSAISVLLAQNAIPEKVKCINLAGEALHSDLVNSILSEKPDASVYNLYGPSEDTTYSTYIKYTALTSEPISIGKIIANSQAYILNDELGLTPFGSLGQLYLAGSGIARGYLGQPHLTAERFIDNPHAGPASRINSERIYKTGDLVRYLPDKNLQFMGRLDEQVKIRGFRIELGEIETHLRNIKFVDSALVMARQVDDSQELIAFIRPTEFAALEAEDSGTQLVNEQLAKYLPDYMIPSIVMLVDDWPLNPNGKIDRKSLLDLDTRVPQGKYISPQNDTERTLTQIWGKLLRLEPEKISSSSNFFVLGGHSLLTIRMLAELNNNFNVVISVQSFFEWPTITELAREILKKINELTLASDIFHSDAEDDEFSQDGEI